MSVRGVSTRLPLARVVLALGVDQAGGQPSGLDLGGGELGDQMGDLRLELADARALRVQAR